MATLPSQPSHPSQQPGGMGERIEKKEEKRCVTCGHTEESHEMPLVPHTHKCLSGGCVCLSFVEGTGGSVATVKKEEEEAAAKKKEEEEKQKKADELKAAQEAKAK